MRSSYEAKIALGRLGSKLLLIFFKVRWPVVDSLSRLTVKVENDAITIAREAELDGPAGYIVASLRTQAASKVYDLVGDDTTTTVVLSQPHMLFHLKIYQVSSAWQRKYTCLEFDLPMMQLTELVNGNQYFMNEVNPHVAFLLRMKEFVRAYRDNFAAKLAQLTEMEVKHKSNQYLEITQNPSTLEVQIVANHERSCTWEYKLLEEFSLTGKMTIDDYAVGLAGLLLLCFSTCLHVSGKEALVSHSLSNSMRLNFEKINIINDHLVNIHAVRKSKYSLFWLLQIWSIYIEKLNELLYEDNFEPRFSSMDNMLSFDHIDFLDIKSTGESVLYTVLDSNLEDKVLIEGGSIVVNPLIYDFIGLEANLQEVFGPGFEIKRGQHITWDPGGENNTDGLKRL